MMKYQSLSRHILATQINNIPVHIPTSLVCEWLSTSTDWLTGMQPAGHLSRACCISSSMPLAGEKCGISSSLSGIEPLIYMPREVLRSSKEILAPKFLAELSLFVAGNQAKMPCGRYRREESLEQEGQEICLLLLRQWLQNYSKIF